MKPIARKNLLKGWEKALERSRRWCSEDV